MRTLGYSSSTAHALALGRYQDSGARQVACRQHKHPCHASNPRCHCCCCCCCCRCACLALLGPSGSGKTAAVYAVAEELGFRVLEVNPSVERTAGQVGVPASRSSLCQMSWCTVSRLHHAFTAHWCTEQLITHVAVCFYLMSSHGSAVTMLYMCRCNRCC
jgi:hypothetical protein